MNIMFVIDGKLVTPQLSSSILDGVTRNTLSQPLQKDMGVTVEERKVSIDEIEKSIQNGNLTRNFRCGNGLLLFHRLPR